MNIKQTTTESVEQTMKFVDNDTGFLTEIKSKNDPTFSICDYGDSDLGSFLSRPVRIRKIDWTIGNEMNVLFNPWTDFFTHHAVTKRLDNFARLQCKLHVKVMINATPFHYGRAIMSYLPWQEYDRTETYDTTNQDSIVMYSQRPKIFIDPCRSEGGEMILPFFHLDNYIDVTDADAINEMGELKLTSFAPLSHANAGTDNVTLTVFAWAEDVSLCVPTVALSAQSASIPMPTDIFSKLNSSAPCTLAASSIITLLIYIISQNDSLYKACTLEPQSKSVRYNTNGSDEYSGGGIISTPASSIAKVAGMLESFPPIAPFAMATRIGASAISSIAKIFGYSRPPILTNTAYYKPKFASTLATCDMPETVTKLTVDSKQEITVDPRTTGLDGQDELLLKYITQKETYFTQFPWVTTKAVDDLLFTTRVAPMLEHEVVPNFYYPTALSFASWPFRYWSGSVILRFQIVASGFHHGRLLFTYEPHGSGSETSGAFNTAYTKIVDIGEETDFELCVAWASEQPYKRVHWPRTITAFANGNSGNGVSGNAQWDNGIVTVRVLNELSAPADTSDIRINVFIRAGDDFELRDPSDSVLKTIRYNPPLLPQSSSTEMEDCDEMMNHPIEPKTTELVGKCNVPMAQLKSQVFFGESIDSFRTVLRRYTKYRSWALGGTVDTYTMHKLWRSHKNLSRGYDVQGVDNTFLNESYNFVSSTLLDYLMPAYAGYRGSQRSKFRVRGGSAEHMDIGRSYDGTVNTVSSVPLPALANSSTIAWTGMTNDESMWGGGVIHPIANQPIGEVEWPFHTSKRFAFARNVGRTNSRDHSSYSTDTVTITEKPGTGDASMLDEYVSVGEDFNLFFFLNAPPQFTYDDPLPTDDP